MGSKNHQVVPTSLIAQISGLRSGVNKFLGSLAKRDLVSKVQNAKCRASSLSQSVLTDGGHESRDDGYKLTYGGYDFLAMRALSKRSSVHSVGNQIGVGKESGIQLFACTRSS
jgi:RIO kinase 2